MKTFHRHVKVGHHILDLDLKESYAEVSFDNMKFNRLDEIVNHLPELSKTSFVEAFVIIANFIFNGDRFEVITNIKGFNSNYLVDKPLVKNNEAVFYVEEKGTGLPYKVTCPFPYKGPEDSFAYSLLPMKD